MKPIMISAKQSITTRQFLEEYLGVECTFPGPLTINGMKEYMEEKGKRLPPSVKFSYLDIESINNGTFLLVRSEDSRRHKKSQLIPYMNPLRAENLILDPLEASVEYAKILAKRREEKW